MSALRSFGRVGIAVCCAAGLSFPADLAALLPKPAGWTVAEEVQRFVPSTLFEHIDGAAESYLGYDFRELVVGQYKTEKGEGTMTVEIYDMGSPRNAFGIYASERFPESRFLDVGVQGYIEEGALNFLAGRYYVKLLAFEAGSAVEGHLRTFAGDIVKAVGDVGGFPPELRAFPREGLVANSEKFIRSDVLGFKFLSNGFLASYKADGQEFDAFLVVARSAEEAASLRTQALDQLAKSGAPIAALGVGHRVKDRYLANVILAQSGAYLCGVTKVKDGGEAVGERVVAGIVRALENR